MYILKQTYKKAKNILTRLIDWFLLLPIRIYRIALHFAKGLQYFVPKENQKRSLFELKNILQTFSFWNIDLFFYVIDLLGIGELYETFLDLVKFNSRPMTLEEIALAKTIFGDSIKYHRVLIDEYAFAGPKQKRFAYVSFYTINSWGKMWEAFLLHELTHVWQYQKIGAIYIPRALRAQTSQMGYNYGGVHILRQAKENEASIFAFNLEQQGDIVADYYKLKNGYKTAWGDNDLAQIKEYEYFINQIRGNA